MQRTKAIDSFIQKLGIPPFSLMAKEIKELPDKKLEQLVNRVDEEDDLIHVDEEGFTVNHGSVGSKGIRYRFR